MVLLKEPLPGTRIYVDYFGQPSGTQEQKFGVDHRGKTLGRLTAQAQRLAHEGESPSLNSHNPSSRSARAAPEVGVSTSTEDGSWYFDSTQKAAEANDIYILSHFHSDHYHGLPSASQMAAGYIAVSTTVRVATEAAKTLKNGEAGAKKSSAGSSSSSSSSSCSWIWQRGPIYCSHLSATMLELVFQIPRPLLRPQGYKEPFVVHRRYVIAFVDANHCPGSVISLIWSVQLQVLKQEKGTRKHRFLERVIMNTGDFRYRMEMENDVRESFKLMQGVVERLKKSLIKGWGIGATSTVEDPHESTTRARRLMEKRSVSAVDTLVMDFSWAHEAFNFIPDKESSKDKMLHLIDRYWVSDRVCPRKVPLTEKEKDRKPDAMLVFLHSHGLGDEELLQSLFEAYPDQKFFLVDHRRYVELMICDVIEAKDSRFVQYVKTHPGLVGKAKEDEFPFLARFFIVRWQPGTRQVVADLRERFPEVKITSLGSEFREGFPRALHSRNREMVRDH